MQNVEYEDQVKTMTKVRRLGVLYFAFCIVLSACSPVNLLPPQTEIFPSPVAFVSRTTPPVPKPTVTPTAVVVPPTAVLPTPAAKRIPQDTSATIGLWGRDLALTQPVSATIDLGVGEWALKLPSKNAQAVALAYQTSHVGFENDPNIATAKPSQVLFDKDKKLALSSDTRQPLLNIRDTEVRVWIGNQAAELVQRGNYDGVLLDGLGQDLIRPSAAPIFTGTKEFTEQQRRDAVEGLLRNVKTKFGTKLLIVGGYAWKDGSAYMARQEEARALAEVGDGIYVSEFLRVPISKTTDFRSEANWRKDVDMLASASFGDRIVLLRTAFIDPNNVPTDEQEQQWMMYTVASYLLGKNGKQTYLHFDVNGRTDLLNAPVLITPLGSPLKAYESKSGIFMRSFSNGIVLVNPSNTTKKIDLDRDYKTESGVSTKSVSMTANTGLILLK
ncbi:MAG: putative glycoside hydrolase [Anaerolineae bacterium]|nr:putative glycoside hydrolase [Anaerolineae bacterium]